MAALGLLCFACGRRRRPSSRPRGVRDASGAGGGADSRPATERSAAVVAAAAAAAADEVEDEKEQVKEAAEANENRPLGMLEMEKGVEVVSDDDVGGGRKRPTPSSRRPTPPSSSPSASSANRLASGESKARSVDQETKGREGGGGRGGTEYGDQEQLDFSALTRAELLSAVTNKDKVDCARRRTATQRRPPSKHALRRILSSDRHPDGSDDDDDGHAQLVVTGIVGASAKSVESTTAAKRRALLGAKSTVLRVGSGQLILPSAPIHYTSNPNFSSGKGSTTINRGSASERKKRVESYGVSGVAANVGVSVVNQGASAAADSRRKYASQPLFDLSRIRVAPGDKGGAAFEDCADAVSAARRQLTAILAAVVPPRTSASQLSLSEMTAADGLNAIPPATSEPDASGTREATRVISPPTSSQLARPGSGDAPPETSPTVSRGSPSDRHPVQASASTASFGAASSTPAASAAIACSEADQASSGSISIPAAVGMPGGRTVVSLKQWTPLLSNAPARRTHGLCLYGDSVNGGRRLMYTSQPSLATTGNAGSSKSGPAVPRLRSGASLNWIAEPPPSAAEPGGSQQRLRDGGDISHPRRPTAAAWGSDGTASPPPVDVPWRNGSRSHLPEVKTYEPAAGRALLLGGLAADMHPLGGQQDVAVASPAGAAGCCTTEPAPQRQPVEDISSRLVGQQLSTPDDAHEAASSGSLAAALGALSNGCESSPKELRQPAPSATTTQLLPPEDEAGRQSGIEAEAPSGGARDEATMDDDAFRRLPTTSTPPASPIRDSSSGVANSSTFGDGGCGDDSWPSAAPVSFSRSRLASAEIRMPESVAAGASAAAVRDRPPPPPPPALTPTPPATVGWRLARDDAPPATPSRRPPWWRPTRVVAAVDDDERVTAAAHRAPPRSRSVDQGLSKATTAGVAVLSQRRSAADGAAAGAAFTAPAAAIATPLPLPVVRRSHSIAATVSPTAAASASIPNWVLLAADKSRRLSRLFKEDAYGSTPALEGVAATATPSTATSPPRSRPQVILHRGRVPSAPASAASALSQPPTPQADTAASAAPEEVWEQPATNGHREDVEPKCAQQLDGNDRIRSVAVAVGAESTAVVAAEKSSVVSVSSDSCLPQCDTSPNAVLSSAIANGKDGEGVQLRFGDRSSLTNGVHLHNGAAQRETNGLDATKVPADARHRSASEYQSPEVDVMRKFVTLRRSQSAAARFTRPSASAESSAVEEPEFVKLARARLARRREAGIITEEDDC